MTLVRVPDDEAKSLLGEGFHTSLRKGADHESADEAWGVINEMPNAVWNDVLSFLVDGIGVMGYCIAKEEDEIRTDETGKAEVVSEGRVVGRQG